MRLETALFPAVLLAFALGTLPQAESSTLYWSGGDGTWDTSSSIWTLDPGLGGPFQAWSNTGPNAAVFSGTAGTVSLGVPITAASLAFSTDGYAITGSTITLSGTASLNSTTGTQTIGSVLAGTVTSLTKTGTGTIKLTGANTYTGPTVIAGGTLAVHGSGASIGVASASAGAMTVGSVGNATLSIENGGSVKNTTATLGASGTTGTVSVDGASSLWNITTTTGNTLSIASGANASLSVTNGGAVTTVRPAIFSPTATNTSSFLVDGTNSKFTSMALSFAGAGTSTATVSGGGMVVNTGNAFVGGGTGVAGVTVTGTGSQWQISGTTTVDTGSALTISDGGTVTSTSTFFLGKSGSGTVTVGGNSATLNILNAAIALGNGNGSIGTLNVNAGGIVNAGFTIRLGNADPSTAIVNQNGGTVTVTRFMEFYVGSPEYHLLGGTYIGQDYSGTAAINFFTPSSTLFELGGGTVQAGTGNFTSTVDATFKTGTTSTLSTPLNSSQVMAWQGLLSGAGTLLKTGVGILDLSNSANSYSGGTQLQQGILNPAVNGALGTGALTFTGNSTVQLPNSQTVDVTLANPVTINAGITATASVQTHALTLNGPITGDGALNKTDASVLILGGTNAYTGDTTVSAGSLRFVGSGAFSPASNLKLAGGVVEAGPGASTTFNYGTGGGEVQWTGSGGFSVAGADGTINYESGADLTWAVANFVPDGSALILSSIASDSTTTFPNNIDLAGAARTVHVDDGSAMIDATLSGTLSNGSLTKTGAGALRLSGANTYTGSTTVSGGMLLPGGALPGNLALDGGVLGASGTYNPTLGTGPGEVQITSNGGGFAAVGGPLSVGSLTGTWGATTGFGSGPLVLSSTGSVDAVTLTADFSLGTAARTITIADNPASTADYAVISGNISSDVGGSLLKNGAGRLVLTGVDTYSGGTTDSAGTLRANVGSIGTGRLSLAGGDIELVSDSDAAPGNALTISSDENTTTSITLDRVTPGAGTTTTLGAATLGTGTADTTQEIHLGLGANVTSGTAALVLGNATLNSDIEFSPAAGTSITVGSLSGTNTWIYASGEGDVNITGIIATTTGRIGSYGAGKLTVSGNNTNTGSPTYSAVVESGTLRATTSANALGLGRLAVDNGRLELANDTGLNFGRNTTIGGNVTIASDVITNGAPGVTQTLGTLSIGALTLTVEKGANVGSGTAGLTFGATTLSASGAIFTTGSGAKLSLGAISGSGRSFTVNGAGNTAITGAITTSSGTLTKSDTGTLTLSGANTYTGITTISGGTLQFAKANSLLASSWTAAKLVVNSGSTAAFNVGGTGEFTAANIDTLKALGTASGGFKSGSFLALDTTNTTGGNFAYGSAIANPNTNANILGLVKLGTGTLTLSGASTYTGATTVSAGKLVVDGSLSASSAVSINSGGTLGGHGTIGPVTINSGGLISPGDSPGTLNTGAESWSGGAGYVWELNAASDAGGAKGVSYDWLNSGGTLDIPATSGSKFTIYVTTLTGSNAPGAAPGFVYGTTYHWVVASAASVTNFSTDKFAIDTSAFFNDPANLGGFTVTNVGNDVVLNLTYVPEPGQWGVMVGLALFGLVLLRRRSRLPRA